MSKISDCYDALQSRMTALFGSHFVLSNPYAPEQNSETQLKKAYGIRLMGGTNTNRNLSCKLSVGRTIEVIFTRKYYGAEFNRDAKETAEKALLEDQYTLIKDIEKVPTLQNSNAVTKFGFLSDNGIEFVFNEDKPFLQLVTQFELEYLEELT